jgi:hypothetical protein
VDDMLARLDTEKDGTIRDVVFRGIQFSEQSIRFQGCTFDCCEFFKTKMLGVDDCQFFSCLLQDVTAPDSLRGGCLLQGCVESSEDPERGLFSLLKKYPAPPMEYSDE